MLADTVAAKANHATGIHVADGHATSAVALLAVLDVDRLGRGWGSLECCYGGFQIVKVNHDSLLFAVLQNRSGVTID